IAFTDVDCILEKNWVQAIVDAYQQDPGFHILSGNTLSFDRGWLGIYHEINGTLNGRKFIGLDRLLYGATANLAITATVAKNVRFNEAFREPACEDVEFCFRANEKGFGIRQVHEMMVEHNYGYSSHAFNNLKGFMKLFKKYGKADIMNYHRLNWKPVNIFKVSTPRKKYRKPFNYCHYILEL
ncbi:MAG: hypothetical protein MUP82_04305, partial [Candidatus Marinimicrobia bacterium]|nr:hypothetical protein [Candidatus Neomarinimicrobiota bacterium]